MVLIFGRCITNPDFRDKVLNARNIHQFPEIYGYKLDEKKAGDVEVYEACRNSGDRAALQNLMKQLHDSFCRVSCPCDACQDPNDVRQAQ
jgi:hypothetical protein